MTTGADNWDEVALDLSRKLREATQCMAELRAQRDHAREAMASLLADFRPWAEGARAAVATVAAELRRAGHTVGRDAERKALALLMRDHNLADQVRVQREAALQLDEAPEPNPDMAATCRAAADHAEAVTSRERIATLEAELQALRALLDKMIDELPAWARDEDVGRVNYSMGVTVAEMRAARGRT